YRAADGWIRLHMNYAYHRDAALRVLAARAEKPAVADAVSRWGARELESAIVDAGGCAAELRTIDAWNAHPQGAAVAGEPLVAREGRVSPRLDRAKADAPLSGVRVLDMTRVIAGPFGTRFLAAMGADVLRIDPRGFEEVGAVLPEATRGKRTAFLDLRSGDDRNEWEALVRDADMLVHGYRAGAMEALGYGEARLRSLNPELAIVRLDAYGWTGAWSARRGFDSLVQMSSGIAYPASGDKPTPLPAQALDHATGYLVAAAACRALSDGAAASRVSLARTARFLVDLGATGNPDAPGITNPEDVLEPSKTAWGESLQVRNPGTIEGYEPRWRHEPGPLGRHAPRWES
ncbi:MAG: CoA transferase, partial [Bacillota bacterium]